MTRWRPNGRKDRERRRLPSALHASSGKKLAARDARNARAKPANGGDRACGQCGAARETISMTDGMGPDGALIVLTFCGARCRDAWKIAAAEWHALNPQLDFGRGSE
jgi:hypothetical protein